MLLDQIVYLPEVEFLRTSLVSRTPQGRTLKSLILDSKPQVFENCPVLGSRIALFFESLKFCWKTPETSREICEDVFFSRLEIAWKILLKNFFFLESNCACVLDLEHSCPWFRDGLSSEELSLASDFFCVLGLEPRVLDSTSWYLTPPTILTPLFSKVLNFFFKISCKSWTVSN